MRRRSRTRRILKWAGLVACVLLTVTIVVSRWWTFGVMIWKYWIYVTRGGVVFMHVGDVADCIWYFEPVTPPNLFYWKLDYQPKMATPYLAATLLMPLAVIAIATLLLWRRDRRYPPGHCRACGYDLAGNVSGVCSECGGAADAE